MTSRPAEWSNRRWLSRVREVHDRKAREQDGVCYVEGIRQVVSAIEGGCVLEAVFMSPALRSEVALEAIERAGDRVEHRVELTNAEFERISARDNPVGVSAIVRWAPRALSSLRAKSDDLFLVADDVRDPGNLGTLVRAVDAAGGAALIQCGGVDAAHPSAIRASLGTMFALPVASATSMDEFFGWAASNGVMTVATSARATTELWDFEPRFPVAVLVGNEAAGLPPDIVAHCDERVRIPMEGTATSLNVSVAAGIVLFDMTRKRRRVR